LLVCCFGQLFGSVGLFDRGTASEKQNNDRRYVPPGSHQEFDCFFDIVPRLTQD
jgi:hypothetical protein